MLGPMLPHLTGLANNLVGNGVVRCVLLNYEAIRSGKTVVLMTRLSNVAIFESNWGAYLDFTILEVVKLYMVLAVFF